MLTIKKQLKNIERDYDVRILYACESGSRAWNFASYDSDYDVRFVYIGKIESYLSLDKKKDVIVMPSIGEYDISGWDFKKFLNLLYNGNGATFEWLNSPIVYKKSALWRESCISFGTYFRVYSSLWHYYNFTIKHIHSIQKEMRLKKLLYAIRGFLVFSYVLHKNTFAPMDFLQLLDACFEIGVIDATFKKECLRIYTQKIQSMESDVLGFDCGVIVEWLLESKEKFCAILHSYVKEKPLNKDILEKIFLKAVMQHL